MLAAGRVKERTSRPPRDGGPGGSRRLDGLSEFGIFWRIMTPLITPALATITVLQFHGAWNNVRWPLLVTRDDALLPILLEGMATAGLKG